MKSVRKLLPLAGAFILVVTLSGCLIVEIELYYDDGYAEGEYATSTLPHYKFVRFYTPTAKSYQLRYVKYYINSTPYSFELEIRDGSAQIIYSDVVTPTLAPAWFIVVLTSKEIYVQNEFYVVMKYLDIQRPFLGADYSDPDGESGEGSIVDFPNLVSLDWMIRATIALGT